MATLFVDSPNNSDGTSLLLEVKYLSECHYILRRSTVFVTLEIAIEPKVNSDDLRVYVHGKIPKTVKEIQKLCDTTYAHLFSLADRSDFRNSIDGIYNFNDTFCHNGSTNTAYELPPPGDKIKVIQSDKEIQYCGFPAHTPPSEFKTEVIDEITQIKIALKNGGEFKANQLYVWRLGFFLHNPAKLDIRWWRKLLRSYPFKYTFHIFSCPSECLTTLRRKGVSPHIDRTRLYLDTTIWSKTDEAASSISVESTSDIWWVVRDEDDCGTLHKDAESIFEFRVQNNGVMPHSECNYVLFSSKQIVGKSPYKEYHLKIKDSSRDLQGKSFVTAAPDGGSLSFQGIISRFNMLKLLSHFRVNLPIISFLCALGVAASNFFISGSPLPLFAFLCVVIGALLAMGLWMMVKR